MQRVSHTITLQAMPSAVFSRAVALIGALVITASACSATVDSGGNDASVSAPASDATAAPTTPADTEATDDTDPTDDTTSDPSSSDAPDDSTSTTSSSSTTTTTTEPEPDVFDADCVVVVQPGESLSLIADRFDDDTVYPASILAENDLEEQTIYPEQRLDVCVDNGLNDISGETRTEPNAAIAEEATRENVQKQQTKLNELFAGLGTPELLVDGISGSVTRQRLCAARLSLGLPVSTADMVEGSEEEQMLMAAEKLNIPFTSAALSERWVLIDQTCQIMFVGRGGEELSFVFPTSTGEPGHETRAQDRSRIYRYDPALDNDGWHDSTDFPVPEDNPLNGNMYKPLYFDGGQAIHGANNVPTSPQSKGCARLRVEHQNLLVGWLGLADASGPTYDGGRINATVNVQGTYVPR